MLCGLPCQQRVWQGLFSQTKKVLRRRETGCTHTAFLGSRSKEKEQRTLSLSMQQYSSELAFAAMTQKGTGMVLTTSEERGDAHRGEPCSWWQAAETKHLATMGATRSTVYTCGLAQKWRLGKTIRPGPVSIMTNFDCSSSLLTGWPSFNDKKGYTGPSSKQCSCGNNHKAEKQERTKKTATHPVTCAEILSDMGN